MANATDMKADGNWETAMRFYNEIGQQESSYIKYLKYID